MFLNNCSNTFEQIRQVNVPCSWSCSLSRHGISTIWYSPGEFLHFILLSLLIFPCDLVKCQYFGATIQFKESRDGNLWDKVKLQTKTLLTFCSSLTLNWSLYPQPEHYSKIRRKNDQLNCPQLHSFREFVCPGGPGNPPSLSLSAYWPHTSRTHSQISLFMASSPKQLRVIIVSQQMTIQLPVAKANNLCGEEVCSSSPPICCCFSSCLVGGISKRR